MDKVPNDFILPFHHKEFSTSTQDWTDEEVGSYVRLLLHQWANGSITDDLTRLQRISNSIEKNAGVVLQKFKPCEEPGRLQNSKMEAIRAEKIEYYEKKRAAGKKGMESRYQTPNTTTNKPSNKNITKEGVGEGVGKEVIKDKKEDYSGFDEFWNIYDKKVGKEKSIKEWLRLSEPEQAAAITYLPAYKLAKEKQFRKDPERFLKNKTWLDEIIKPEQNKLNGNNNLKRSTEGLASVEGFGKL
jgi:uncharacterized protein YdaU (DUF1376 family)